VFGAILALLIGLGISGPAALWSPDFAQIGGRWETMALTLVISILFLGGAAARYLEEYQPSSNAKLLLWRDRFTEKQWLWLAFGAWVLGWASFHIWTDPTWVSSGIDWHDSHLDAYSLLYGDPPLYCAWRYPFYPYMAATLSYWTDIDLQYTTQFVSRVVAAATAIPLFIIGRSLFGRSAAISGIVLLTGLATYRMHTDAVTPYPMVMFLAATGSAALITAIKGKWMSWLVLGTCTAALLANDGKSLLISLGFVGLALPLALFIRGSVPSKALRLALILGPIAASYQWMSALPVKAFTLEEMAVAYLVPGGRGEAQAPRNLQTGYMWGHFEDAATIPRTLLTFYEAGRDPRLSEQNERQKRTSLQRLSMDYPGFTRRVPLALSLCLFLPLVVRRDRWNTAIKTAAVSVILASCWPSIKSDYQERYVVHGAVILPLLTMGGIGFLARVIIGSRTPTRRLIRGASLVVCALALLIWPANPVGFAQLSDRLDPVAMGGLQEHEVAEWGREHLKSGDLLLDTSWMMQALLLSGSHTVARSANAYPPGGASWPAGAWRFTRPWPEERQSSGQYFALVNYLAMAPNTFDATHIPIEDLITKPDTEMGQQIAEATATWEEVFRTSDTIVRIYRYTGNGIPPRWQTRRRPM
jgi:hypothetical protein